MDAPEPAGPDVARRDRAGGDVDTAELIELAVAGGERGAAAWNVLVRRFAPAVWKALWTVGLSADDRDDAFQATWLRALERLHGVREPAKLHVWLMVIARNEGLAVASRSRRLSPTDEPLDDVDRPDFDAAIVRDERRVAARAAIAQLPPETQQLLRLLSVDPPITYAEIESIMGWPRGGTAIRRSRAIERLRGMPSVQQLLVGPDDGAGLP